MFIPFGTIKKCVLVLRRKMYYHVCFEMSRNVVRTATISKSVISNFELLVILELEPMSFALSNVIVFISSQLAKIL